MIRPKKFFALPIYYILLIVNFLFSGIASGEYKPQAKEIFWIDVPEGWTMSEDPSTVLLVNPTQTEQVYIRFKSVEGITGDQKEFLTNLRDEKRREMAKRGGKSVMKVERKVDGVYALQTGFLVPSDRGLLQATSVYFIHEGRLFDISFEAPHEFQRLEMETVIDTLRFKKPESPKVGEAGESAIPEEKKPHIYEVTEPIPLPANELKF